MQLEWHKNERGQWWMLHELDLALVAAYGVFIIWRNGDPRRAPAVLYIGRGLLRHEIARCGRDPLFRGSGGVHVTWAAVDDPRDVEAIASYLYQHLRPIWGEVIPPSPRSVPVNLPLSA